MAEMRVPTIAAALEAYGLTDLPDEDVFRQPAVTVEQDDPPRPGVVPLRLVINADGIRAGVERAAELRREQRRRGWSGDDQPA